MEILVYHVDGSIWIGKIIKENRKTFLMEFNKLDDRYGRYVSGLNVYFEQRVAKYLVHFWIDNPLQIVFADWHFDYANRNSNS